MSHQTRWSTTHYNVTRANGDRQQNLVDILTALATTDPRRAATTTDQVLPWARIHPGDLSDEELIWRGITSDIDLATGGGLQQFSITAVNIGPAATSSGRPRLVEID
jgi:hypothetical protein